MISRSSQSGMLQRFMSTRILDAATTSVQQLSSCETSLGYRKLDASEDAIPSRPVSGIRRKKTRLALGRQRQSPPHNSAAVPSATASLTSRPGNSSDAFANARDAASVSRVT